MGSAQQITSNKRIPLDQNPNGWYRVIYSDELAIGDVKRLHFFGRELVCYRGEDGKARVVDAYCRHLGAHLGEGGQVEGDLLVCPFHGWKWDGDSGACVEVPYSERINRRAVIDHWETRELNGYVIMWYHANGDSPTYEIPDIPETSNSEFKIYKRMYFELDTHIQEIYENVVDVAHFEYLHKMDVINASWEPLDGDNGPLVRLHVALKRENEEQSTADGDTTIESYMYGPGLQVTRLSGRMEGVSVNSITPYKDEKVLVSHAYYIKKGDETSERDIENFWDYYVDDHKLDFRIWNNKVYLEKPVLVDNDGDIMHFRRWFSQFYSQ